MTRHYFFTSVTRCSDLWTVPFETRLLEKSAWATGDFVVGRVVGERNRLYECETKTGRMADFYERHGIRREERAAVLVLDCLAFPVIFWGSLKAGVVPVALNTLRCRNPRVNSSSDDAICRRSRFDQPHKSRNAARCTANAAAMTTVESPERD